MIEPRYSLPPLQYPPRAFWDTWDDKHAGKDRRLWPWIDMADACVVRGVFPVVFTVAQYNVNPHWVQITAHAFVPNRDTGTPDSLHSMSSWDIAEVPTPRHFYATAFALYTHELGEQFYYNSDRVFDPHTGKSLVTRPPWPDLWRK